MDDCVIECSYDPDYDRHLIFTITNGNEVFYKHGYYLEWNNTTKQLMINSSHPFAFDKFKDFYQKFINNENCRFMLYDWHNSREMFIVNNGIFSIYIANCEIYIKINVLMKQTFIDSFDEFYKKLIKYEES